MTAEPTTHDDEGEDLCPVCWAKDCAKTVLEAAVWNALAAGLDPDDIFAAVCEAIDPAPDEPDTITAETPTIGVA